jgi:hypothetical protein
VIAAGNDANTVFIENGREHGDRIIAALLDPSRDQTGSGGAVPRAHPARSR